MIDSVSFSSLNEDLSLSRLPNGTGDFTETTQTFNAENGVVSTISVEEEHLIVYPNPAKDNIRVKLQSGNPTNIMLYSADGKLVYQENFSDQLINIPLQSIPDGFYQLVVIQNQNKLNKKIVVLK